MSPAVTFRSKKEFVYGTLRAQILSGELAPNARLIIDELSRGMNVSAIPVREALQQLQSEGLVQIEPYVGARVSDIHQGFIEEIFALLEAFAWGVHKTTLYTITNRRIVMRIGVALSVTYNLPFSQIISADLRADRNGNGDIAFVLAPGARLSLMVFWPHARGWRKGRMIPQMIGLDKAADVGRLLAAELQAHGQASAVAAARDDGAQSVRETVVMAAE